jgi:ubiquinol-cytochrome c reductase iron-sulfur subunit
MTNDHVDSRRRHFLVAAVSTVSGAGVAITAVSFIESMEPSARALAARDPIDINISKIGPAS